MCKLNPNEVSVSRTMLLVSPGGDTHNTTHSEGVHHSDTQSIRERDKKLCFPIFCLYNLKALKLYA
jgi:hypothetical protein